MDGRIMNHVGKKEICILLIASTSVILLPFCSFADQRNSGHPNADTGPYAVLELDGQANAFNLATPPSKAVLLPQGKYKITLETTYNYGGGNPLAKCNKVVLYAITDGHPDGFAWVLTAGKSLTIDLVNSLDPNLNLELWAFFPEGGTTADNLGGATLRIYRK